jgi:zinc-finger-containing domain
MMEAPKVCPYCDHEVILTSNKELYGKEFGNGKCYLCRTCKASVGVHTGKGNRPLGILATQEMKALKILCHELFDPIWRSGNRSRNHLYQILATLLDIDPKDCHFGHFETPRLQEAIQIMSVPNWWETEEGCKK